MLKEIISFLPLKYKGKSHPCQIGWDKIDGNLMRKCLDIWRIVDKLAPVIAKNIFGPCSRE